VPRAHETPATRACAKTAPPDVPQPSSRVCPPAPRAAATMSDSSSDDDVPLSQLQAPAKPAAKPAAKPKAKKPPPSSSSDDSDDEPVKPPPKKRAKPKPKYKESSDDDSSDSDDEPIQKKRAARKPAKRKAPAKKEPAPKRRKSSTGSTARKPKQLTKVQRLEKALGAFEWWNAPDPPEGKSWTTLEHAGVTFEPQYVPHNVPLVYEGAPVKLTPRQEELATFYASMPEDGPQLSVKGGQREIFQKNFWDDFSKALGASHTIKSFKGCDFTRISEHLDRQKAIRRSASDAEKKATKEMKDKQLLKSGFALLDGHVEKVGNFRMEPPSLFRGRGKHPRTGVVKQRTEPDRVAINVGRDRAPPRCHEPGRSWSDVQHDDSVTWLATWHENVMSPRLSFPTFNVMPHRRDGVDAAVGESTRLAR
jgi:DNA topoisomerase-1